MQNDLDELKKSPVVLRLYKQRVKLEHNGPRFRGTCPLGKHKDSTPSFDVFLHEGVYLFNCMGCGSKGNIFQFISTIDGIPMNDAIKLVRSYVQSSPEHGAEEVDKVFKPALTENKPKLAAPLTAVARYEEALAKNQQAQDWLKKRGITYETAKQLHTGYIQDIGALIGQNDHDIQDQGWIVLPCVEGDKVVSIKFRSIARKAFRKQKGMASDVLYNVDDIDPLEPVFLTEGEFDTMVLKQAGFRAVSLPNATSNTTPAMLDKLLASDLIVLAGDNDGAVGTEKMKQLWTDLPDRATLLEWPAGCKDANETFLTESKGDVTDFKERVNNLVNNAKSVVMPGIYSLAESMTAHNQSDLANHPRRFRFPWKNVDEMAIILPGDVVAVLATSTKMGKTCWIMNATLSAAMNHNEIVLNYQCELDTDRFNTMVAAYVLGKDRNHLTKSDHAAAAKILKDAGVRYYVGSNPALNTVGPVLKLIEQAITRTRATVVVLDHIHFICRNEKDEIKAQADASQWIARMTKMHKVKFFMIEQPRKSNQQNRGKRLQISDGKGSEALHSDAAAIFAIHRDLVKVTEPPPPDSYSPITYVHLLGGARSKGDGAAEGRLMFNGKFALFSEIARSPEPGETPGLA
jgi:hypothetical protein